MLTQNIQLKIISIGNSQGVILPKEVMDGLHAKVGQTIPVERSSEGILLKSLIKTEKKSSVTLEFKKWLDTFVSENETLIKELAKR